MWAWHEWWLEIQKRKHGQKKIQKILYINININPTWGVGSVVSYQPIKYDSVNSTNRRKILIIPSPFRVHWISMRVNRVTGLVNPPPLSFFSSFSSSYPAPRPLFSETICGGLTSGVCNNNSNRLCQLSSSFLKRIDGGKITPAHLPPPLPLQSTSSATRATRATRAISATSAPYPSSRPVGRFARPRVCRKFKSNDIINQPSTRPNNRWPYRAPKGQTGNRNEIKSTPSFVIERKMKVGRLKKKR